MKLPFSKHARAFSLAEILISIGIIAFLAALLAPAYNKILENSRSGKCMSNLRQIGVAMNAYAGDHNQKYPPIYNDAGNAPEGNQPWMWHLKEYAGMEENSMGTAPLPRAAGIFVCPSLPANNQRWVSYAVNNFMTYNSGRQWRYSTLSIPPASTIIAAEVSYNGEYYSPLSSGPVSRRHSGPSANYLFADGHAENIKEPIPATDRRWADDAQP